MTISDEKRQLAVDLAGLYEEREAQAIAEMVFEKLTGLTRIQLLLDRAGWLTSDQLRQLQSWKEDLLRHRPVQYVLGEAWFMGMPFFVQEGALVPRPETEELVLWVLETMDGKPGNALDIGTGSGCVAISIARNNPQLHVLAVDSSPEALRIAEKNNQKLQANVSFREMDILVANANDFPEKWDVIVSNPPYIAEMERNDMNHNVLGFEPEMALFVPDADPLLFYRAIANLATQILRSGGYLFFEINEKFGKEVVDLLAFLGFKDVVLRKDLQGRHRLVKALWLVN
ncbi:MAG: peptide chain release factor N(5)-glutamine methyltransferase [Chitinophagaceae bacterium]